MRGLIDEIHVTRTARGTFLAATNSSPYFLLEADSEAELIERVRGAVAFYKAHHATTPPRRPSKPVTVTRFVVSRVVKADDLAAA